MDDYKRWYQQVTDLSYQAIKSLNNMSLPENAAIVFDIDDTLIRPDGQPIFPILNLYNYSKEMGLTLILITNRLGNEMGIKYTQEQLTNIGVFGYKSLYFRSPEKEDNPWRYKEISRKSIFERGFQVVMSVGDQPWDIGKYGGVGVKVPVYVV